MSEPTTEAGKALLREAKYPRDTVSGTHYGIASATVEIGDLRAAIVAIEAEAKADGSTGEGLAERLRHIEVGTVNGLTEDRIARIVTDASYALARLEEGDTRNALAALRRGFQRGPVRPRAASQSAGAT